MMNIEEEEQEQYERLLKSEQEAFDSLTDEEKEASGGVAVSLHKSYSSYLKPVPHYTAYSVLRGTTPYWGRDGGIPTAKEAIDVLLSMPVNVKLTSPPTTAEEDIKNENENH